MAQKGKFLITDEGPINLASHVWDDQMFSDRLSENNPISRKQAMAISRFLRDTIDELEVHTITPPVIDEILKVKLTELGLPGISPIRFEKSIFIKNGLALSKNAKTVLDRNGKWRRDR